MAATAEIRSLNPADPEDVVAAVAPAGGIDVDRAPARRGGGGRRVGRLPAAARGEALRRAADDVEADAAALADLICREVGKPIVEARGEVARTVAILRFYSGVVLDPEGESYPPSDGRSLLFTRRAPRGVVGLITPWNFPLAIPAWKLAPGAGIRQRLRAGSRPQHAPACADRLAEILGRHLPRGRRRRRPRRGRDRAPRWSPAPACGRSSFTGSERVGHKVATAARRPRHRRPVRDGRPERLDRAGRRRRRGVGRDDRVGRDGLRRPEVHRHRPGGRASRRVAGDMRDALVAAIERTGDHRPGVGRLPGRAADHAGGARERAGGGRPARATPEAGC